jgi:hypothetical protein
LVEGWDSEYEYFKLERSSAPIKPPRWIYVFSSLKKNWQRGKGVCKGTYERGFIDSGLSDSCGLVEEELRERVEGEK